MSRFVVDASVAVKWFLPEIYSTEARSLLSSEHELIGPEFVVAEVAHVAVKRLRRRQLRTDQARVALAAIPSLMQLRPFAHLVIAAVEVARRFDRSAYDALYVVAAIREGCPLITADRKLFDAVAGSLPESIVWIEDVSHGS